MRSNGAPALYPNLPFATPTARGATVSQDLRWTWDMLLFNFTGCFELAAALVLSAWYGRRGRGDLAKPLLTAGFSIGVLFSGIAAVKVSAEGNLRLAGIVWGFLSSHVSILAGVSVLEARIVPCLFATAVLNALSNLLRHLVIYPDYELLDTVVSPAFPVGIFAAFVAALRRNAIRSARSMVARDREVYDRIWADVMRAPEVPRQLDELRGRVQELLRGKEHHDVRQRFCVESDGAEGGREAAYDAAARMTPNHQQSWCQLPRMGVAALGRPVCRTNSCDDIAMTSFHFTVFVCGMPMASCNSTAMPCMLLPLFGFLSGERCSLLLIWV
jgi:hypothetical protein